MDMKSKAIIAMAGAGTFLSAGAIANQTGHSNVNLGQPAYVSASPSSPEESSFGMSTLTSLDTRTGGYKGWGPMANFMGPSASPEINPIAQIDREREHRQHVAEVQAERQDVWVANAPLRSEYENIGATRSEAGGFGGFFSRDKK
jgi:hypothetical protein